MRDTWQPVDSRDLVSNPARQLAASPLVRVIAWLALNMVAAVANGGTLYKPMLLKNITKANGEVVQESKIISSLLMQGETLASRYSERFHLFDDGAHDASRPGVLYGALRRRSGQ